MTPKEWVSHLSGVREDEIPFLGESAESRFAYAALTIAEIALREREQYWSLAASMYPGDKDIQQFAAKIKAEARR